MIDICIKKKISNFELDVNLQTQANVIGITGVSGSGKTTLLNCITGLIRPDQGNISIDNNCFFNAPNIDIPVHKRDIAVVFQDNRLFPHMSVEGNLEFALKHSKRKDKTFTIEQIAKLVEIEHLIKRSIKNLSGGELKRVAIARAILSHPRLLLMDEPFAGMDGELSWRILHILEQIRCSLKIPMVLVSHTLDELQSLCDLLIIMRDGKIEASGKISDFLASKQAMRLLRTLDYSNRIDGIVDSIDHNGGIMNVRIADSFLLRAPISKLSVGSKASYTLRTKDIAISTAHIPDISIQNQVACRVKDVIYAETGVICVLECGVEFLAEITIETAQRFNLKGGNTAWALFKTQALTAHLSQTI